MVTEGRAICLQRELYDLVKARTSIAARLSIDRKAFRQPGMDGAGAAPPAPIGPIDYAPASCGVSRVFCHTNVANYRDSGARAEGTPEWYHGTVKRREWLVGVVLETGRSLGAFGALTRDRPASRL